MKRVVIIGAGYGGLKLFERLSKSGLFEVMLFDKHPYHFMQTEVYKYIANKTRFTDITVDLHTLECGHGESLIFTKETVETVHFEHKKVITATRRISYDYLVIASGAKTNFAAAIPGLQSHFTYDIKNLHGALRFKQAFESALITRFETEGEHNGFSIVVIGAGLSGVEIAAEMAHFAQMLYKKNHFLCNQLRISLVSSTQGVLGGLDSYLRRVSLKRLKKLGIDVLEECRAVEIGSDFVTLDSGKKLESSFTLFAGGITPSSLAARLELDKDERGFILVDRFLQVQAHPGVFALGDCALICDEHKKRLPATADIAETSAALVAHNILKDHKGLPLKRQRLKSRGVLIALGGRYAAAKIGPLRFSGLAAFMMKRAVELFYMLRLRRSCKIGINLICKNRMKNERL